LGHAEANASACLSDVPPAGTRRPAALYNGDEYITLTAGNRPARVGRPAATKDME